MAHKGIVLAFDAYGTLFSPESIAKKLATHFGGDKANTIATAWRRHQLEYTWRATCMGIYFDFFLITRRALKHALGESGVTLDDSQIKEMMEAYNALSAFPDVPPAFSKLQDVPDVRIVIHSNGTHDMVSALVHTSLPSYSALFQDIVSVEQCRKYKPAQDAYEYLASKMGKDTLDAKQMGQIWHVSSNPFDVAGARAMGMNSIWVDRAGKGWQDSLILTERGRPTEIVSSLDGVVGIISRVTDAEKERNG